MTKTLEELIRGFAAKGELVHLSLVAVPGGFVAKFAAASPAGGYAMGEHADPVAAVHAAFDASPAKPKRMVSARPTKEITAAVTPEPDAEKKPGTLDQWTS